ncbi:MAG: NAD(+) synthase [Caulobacterales bacterium]|nr:NAD(+) synthase [Caulobacterales bacterium]
MSTHPFYSLYAQGFARVGACTPRASIADPAANAAAHIALAREADAAGAAVAVFPELSLSAYAIDDLHLQATVIAAVETALADVVEASKTLTPVIVLGAPVRRGGRLYNCAVFVHRGRILGVTPKSFLPNYREFYEKRWFASGVDAVGLYVTLAGQDAPFGVDLVFQAEDLPHLTIHAEICEDLWSPAPPSQSGALAGATLLLNLSASNITIGKADVRRTLCMAQSNRLMAAYVYCAAGAGESTTDLAWDGQASVYELGDEIAVGERFAFDPRVLLADVDLERVNLERLRTGTFHDAARAEGEPEQLFRTVEFTLDPPKGDLGLQRPVARFPFVPADPARLDQDCYEAYNIQVHGLIRRLESTGSKTVTIGVSGGLDSAHALIVAARAFDLMGKPRSGILGFTLPGFATGAASKGYAWDLMRALEITAEEIDIKPAAMRMLTDLDHPYARGEAVYDLTFENVQAGLRTDYLFRAAGQRGGLVVGTGDLSELALGWATYGVGDHMSHYNVNAGVPKTLIQHLIRWTAGLSDFKPQVGAVLNAIVAAEISPELKPAENGVVQSTESVVGPYALQDFNLFHIARYGQRPSKAAFLAWHAWKDAKAGAWPPAIPLEDRVAYDLPTIKHWLAGFCRRFFQTAQFKRSAMPNGPKVSAGGALSPRGDWRAPSDGAATAWLAELEAGVPG